MKKYCVSFGNTLLDCRDKWCIEYTDKFNNYNKVTDKYGVKQIFDTEEEAINSIRELRAGAYYKKIGY